MFLTGIVLQPLFVVALVGIGLFFYMLGGPIVGLLERIEEWYQSNYNYKLMATKITITVGIVFAICSKLFGFDTSWTVLKMLTVTIAIITVLFVTGVGIVLTIVYIVEKVQSFKKSRAAKMKTARATSPDSEIAPAIKKQSDSVFRIIWMYLKTLKENYLCPFIEIPEGAIRPRTRTYFG
jgi:Na+/H+-dicarboxylate symporter